jgi:hypothetical protein
VTAALNIGQPAITTGAMIQTALMFYLLVFRSRG